MALPSSGAINIGKYNRELLYRSGAVYLNPAWNYYLQRNMNDSKFRYLNGATTDSSQISMSSGYGRYGLPRHTRLSPSVASRTYLTQDFVVDSNNSMYVVGYTTLYAGGGGTTANRYYGTITKMTTTASGGSAIAWAKRVRIPNSISDTNTGDFVNSIVLSADESYLIVVVEMSDSFYAYYMYINTSTGAINTIRYVTRLGFDRLQTIHQGADGSLYMVGYDSYSGIGIDGSLWKLNSDLTPNYNFNFGANSRTQVFFGSAINASNIVMVGFMNDAAYAERGLVVLNDLNGNVVWYKYFSSPDGSNSGCRLAKVTFDTSGNVYVVGYWSAIQTGYTTYTEKAFIAKLDSSGNLLWASHSQLLNGAQRYTGIAYNSDGYLYVSGYTAYGLLITAVYQTDGTLVRFRTTSATFNSGTYGKFFIGERGNPRFDNQGNVICAARHDTAGVYTSEPEKTTVFHREKLYSTNSEYKELISITSTNGEFENLLVCPGISSYTTELTTWQSYPAFDSSYSISFTTLTVGTQIAASTLADTYGYILPAGQVVTADWSTLVSYADNEMYTTSQTYA